MCKFYSFFNLTVCVVRTAKSRRRLSSFQLLDMKRSPHIAVMTNLAPNHLDVHKDMDEYIAAKENIYLHQHEGDIAIFNEDNDITRKLSKKAAAWTRLFSRREEVMDGAFLRGDSIVLRHDGCEEAVMQISDIRLPGMHNVENYLAAVTALDGLVPYEVMRETARTFAGVEHRIEPVRTIRGVQWYNDSIASSPTRTIAGLNAFNEKVILLAGGYDKHALTKLGCPIAAIIISASRHSSTRSLLRLWHTVTVASPGSSSVRLGASSMPLQTSVNCSSRSIRSSKFCSIKKISNNCIRSMDSKARFRASNKLFSRYFFKKTSIRLSVK